MDSSSREANYVDVLLVKAGTDDFAYEGIQAFIARSDLPPEFNQDPDKSKINAAYTGCGSPNHLKRLRAGAGGLHDVTLPFSVPSSSCFFQAGCPPPSTNTAFWGYLNSHASTDPYTDENVKARESLRCLWLGVSLGCGRGDPIQHLVRLLLHVSAGSVFAV